MGEAARGAALSEAEGREVLKARFEAAGFAIEEDHLLRAAGADVRLDGYDPRARVGYEFITTQAGDRAEFTPAVVAALEAGNRAGAWALLLVDEAEVDANTLAFAADRFLQRAGRPA